MTVIQIILLSPNSLEQLKPVDIMITRESLIQNREPSLIPGFPLKQIPDYFMEQVSHVSIQKTFKQWNIKAQKAFFYSLPYDHDNPTSSEKQVHARTIQAYLYDGNDQITRITGQEAKYTLNKKKLEIYGKVNVLFPDGFEVTSEYLKYQPENKQILISTEYAVTGSICQSNGQLFAFKSLGMDYQMETSQINLLKKAVVSLTMPTKKNDTIIQSDFCTIDRMDHLAHFKMDPNQPISSQFVHIFQPTLFARARKAKLYYGDFKKILHSLIASDEVLIKEIQKDLKTDSLLRYATSEKALFDMSKNKIVLTGLPQVYQNQDTVTGDTILIYRNTDTVEVEQSNGFSKGN